MLPLLALFLLASLPTANFDLNRTNANLSETQLTPATVSGGQFKLLGSYAVDGFIFAQPIYVQNITTSGVVHNLVIVATLNNSVYAFDADVPGGAPVWSNLVFATPYSNYPITPGFPFLYNQPMGCLSTPVADVPNLKLYVVCDTVVGTTPNWVIRQLDLTTGATLLTTTITGQVTGTGDVGHGDTTSGPNLLFYPRQHCQRTGLTLANNNVYVGFCSMDDIRPWHGWIMAYSTSTLAQTAVWCGSPNGFGAGLWGSGGGFAVDGSGNLYVTTGNGTDYDGVTNFTNSVVKFSPSLSVLDWFEPSNNVSINAGDIDTASNRITLIPGTSSAVVAGKDFNVYLLDTTCMGHLQGSSGCSLQTFKSNGSGTPSVSSGSYGMAFVNNILYLPTTAGSIYAFSFSSGSFNTTPLATQTNTYGFPGPAQIAGAGNGSSNIVLWAVTSATSSYLSVQQGILRAINPTTLSEIWNSSTSGHDTLGNMSKFTAPLPAGGKVFVATQDSKVQVFGIASSSTLRGQAGLRGAGGIR